MIIVLGLQKHYNTQKDKENSRFIASYIIRCDQLIIPMYHGVIQVIIQEVGCVMNENELVSIGVAAKELGLDRQKLQRWERDGLLPFCVNNESGRHFFRRDFEKIRKIDEVVSRTKSIAAAKEELNRSSAVGQLKEREEEDKMIALIEKAFGKEDMLRFFRELGTEMAFYRERTEKQDEIIRSQAEEMKALREEMAEMKKLLQEPQKPAIDQEAIMETIKKRDEELMENLRQSMKDAATAKEEEDEPKKKGFWGKFFGG
jgi:DNA-binding transcriptional MerR regulator